MKPNSHQDLGLSDDSFLELVDFFRELIRLDEKPNYTRKLIRVLRCRLNQLKQEKRNELLQQLEGLEKT